VWQERGADIWQVDEIVIPTSNTTEMAAEIVRRYGRGEFQSDRAGRGAYHGLPRPGGRATAHLGAGQDRHFDTEGCRAQGCSLCRRTRWCATAIIK